MTEHEWGDDWFLKHGTDLDNAIEYIVSYVKRHTGCTLVCKEKYGTIRYEFMVPPSFVDWSLWLYRKWITYSWKVCLRAAQDMVNTYPELEDEIMEDLAIDCHLVGLKTHKKYWE